MSGLEVFLAFVTLWVLIIAAVIYFLRRLTAPVRQRGTCCMEFPCSAKCAKEHQAARDRLIVEYDKIVHEIGSIVTAGHELKEAAPAASGHDWPAGS